MKFTKETELYEPIKQFLINSGYEVKSEIKNCDVVAMKDGKMLVVELKLRLNLDVLLQSADRQKTADMVYVAVPAQKHSKRTEKVKYVLKRLEIGLIYVGTDGGIKVIFDAEPFDMASCRSRYKKHREKIENEFNQRLGDLNTGGSKGKTLMTEYRQSALLIVGILHEIGSGTAAQIKKLGGSSNTYSIIRDNYYGWFEKIDRGVYTLTDLGKKAYQENEAFIVKLIKMDENEE